MTGVALVGREFAREKDGEKRIVREGLEIWGFWVNLRLNLEFKTGQPA